MRIFRDDEGFFIVVEELNSILNISLLTGMSSNTINKSCYVRTTNLPLAILYCTKITKETFWSLEFLANLNRSTLLKTVFVFLHFQL